MPEYKENSFATIFQNRANKYQDKICVKYKKEGEYLSKTWSEMNQLVRRLSFYFLNLKIKPKDKIALFSGNRYEWWIADLAILSSGAINVPLYATNSSEEAFYILNDSEAKICLVGDEEQLNKVLEIRKKLPNLERIIIFDSINITEVDVLTFEAACILGEDLKKEEELEKRLEAIEADDLATIIYTSGTTGDPKGVMLTHNNFVSNGVNTLAGYKGELFNEEDLFLSFLPLSHVLERTAGYGAAVYTGSTTVFAESINKLLDDFQEVRPTVMVSVPRIYEKIRAGILSKVSEASFLKKMIFNFALSTAKKNLPYACQRLPRQGLFAKRYNLADKLVFSKLKEALGLDRLKYAISGGGPLGLPEAEFFIGMGIEILEGFGLTETSPITNYNRPGEIKPGTVGRAIPETEIKISEEGEVLIKGPQVMKGYYKNPEATKEVFTEDGFFRSGDLGLIDEKGRLTITGRIKDIIVTAGGKNISPQNIENSVKTSLFIEQIGIIGDKRKYLSALVIPNFEELEKWAKNQALSFTSRADLIKKKEVHDLIRSEIDEYTKKFARVEQIRNFTLLEAEWTQETGELTPKQSVKRRVLMEKYAVEIEGMYPPE